MNEEDLCKTIITRLNSIDYRPHIHHNLYKKDDSFDSKFNALYHHHNYIEKILQSIFSLSHKDLFKTLCNITRNLINCNENEIRKIRITYINTGLSDDDRIYLIDHNIKKTYLSYSNIQFIDMTPDDSRNCTAFDWIVLIADCLYHNLKHNSNLLNKNNVIKQIEIHHLKSNKQDKIKESPLEAITTMIDIINSYRQTLSSQETQIDTIVIVLQFCEKIETHIMNNLLVLLHELPYYIHIVAYIDIMCPLPVLLSPSVQAIFEVSILATVSPWDLYDEYCARIYNSKDIPFTITAAVIDRLHTIFQETEFCITSMSNRIIIYHIYILLCIILIRFGLVLLHHFQHRRSLLCMYQDIPWLKQMYLISKNIRAITVSSLSLDITNLLDCNNQIKQEEEELDYDEDIINDNINDNNKDSEVLINNSTHKLHRKTISKLLSIMDGNDLLGTGLFLVSKSDKSRAKEVYNTESLFAKYEERMNIDNIWITCLKMLRDGFIPYLQRRNFSIAMIWADLILNKQEQLNTSNNNRTEKQTLINVLSLQSKGIIKKLIEQIKDQLEKKSISTIRFIISEIYNYINQYNHKCDIINNEYKLYLNSLSTNLHTIDETFEILIDMMENTEVDSCYSYIQLKQKYLYNQNNNIITNNHTVEYDITLFYNHLLDDLKGWLLNIYYNNYIYNLYIPLSIPGILELNIDTQNELLDLFDTNIHAKFADALEFPEKVLSNNNSNNKRNCKKNNNNNYIPDAHILYSTIKSCKGKEAAIKWYKCFEIDLMISNQSVTNKKRKNTSGLDEKTMLECRFANTVYDIEKSGIIKCSITETNRNHISSSSTHITRQIYTWV